MQETFSFLSMAKINLGLDVVGVREDGYHELRMVMQTIKLCDKLLLTPTSTPGIMVQTNLNFLPTNERNVAFRAAKMLIDEFDITDGVNISLEKHIPVSAGMAGGSSNAAAVLVGINRMFRLGLSTRELMKRGAKLGADVPFCILRGTALAEGIGDILTPLPPMPDCYVVIVKPNFFLSTKYVYASLDLDKIQFHPNIDNLYNAIWWGDAEMMADNMGNVLEEVTIPAYPEIQQCKEELLTSGAFVALMSGSGPTVFGLFYDQKKARHAAYSIHSLYPSAFVRCVELFQPKHQEFNLGETIG